MKILDKDFCQEYINGLIGNNCALTPFCFSQSNVAETQEIRQIVTYGQSYAPANNVFLPLRSYGSIIRLSSGTINVDFSNSPESAFWAKYFFATSRNLVFGTATDLSLVNNSNVRSIDTFFIPLGSVITGTGVIAQTYFQGPCAVFYNGYNGMTVVPRSENLYIGNFQASSPVILVGPNNATVYINNSTQLPVFGIYDSLLAYNQTSGNQSFYVNFSGFKVSRNIVSKSNVNYYTRIGS